MLPSSALSSKPFNFAPPMSTGFIVASVTAPVIYALFTSAYSRLRSASARVRPSFICSTVPSARLKRILPLMGISSSASLNDSCRGSVKSAVEKAVSSITTFMSRE